MFATYPEINGGMYYADQRMYNPQMGKFFSPDPGGKSSWNSGNPGSWNQYLYSNGDPINSIDPSGMDLVMIGGSCDSSGEEDCGGDNEETGCEDCVEDPPDTSGGSGDDGTQVKPTQAEGDCWIDSDGTIRCNLNYALVAPPPPVIAPPPGVISAILGAIAEAGETVAGFVGGNAHLHHAKWQRLRGFIDM